jgi:hypothetical protein
MNTKLNLWKDKKAQIKLNKEEITQEKILMKTKKCDEKFDTWQTCIKGKSWNDEECVGKLKPNYEFCIEKRNLMQSIMDKRIDEEI